MTEHKPIGEINLENGEAYGWEYNTVKSAVEGLKKELFIELANNRDTNGRIDIITIKETCIKYINKWFGGK